MFFVVIFSGQHFQTKGKSVYVQVVYLFTKIFMKSFVRNMLKLSGEPLLCNALHLQTCDSVQRSFIIFPCDSVVYFIVCITVLKIFQFRQIIGAHIFISINFFYRSTLKVGPPNDDSSKIGALVSKQHLDKVYIYTKLID